MRSIITFLLLSFVFYSCVKQSTAPCSESLAIVSFRFLDKNTKADLVANSTMQTSQVSVKDEVGRSYEVLFRGVDSIKVATVFLNGNKGIRKYKLYASKKEVDFTMNIITPTCEAFKSELTIHAVLIKDARGFYVVPL